MRNRAGSFFAMILFIDTSHEHEIILALVSPGGSGTPIRIPVHFDHGRKLLPAIQRLLTRKKITPSDLDGVIVVDGPGRFSALRAGIATANALATAAGIPVAGIVAQNFPKVVAAGLVALRKAKVGHLVIPRYGQEPNITLAK